jgi:hypothetical protein
MGKTQRLSYGHDFVIANKDCFNGLLKDSDEDWEKHAPVKCKKSKSKVFKNKDPYDVIEIDITSNFKGLNDDYNITSTNAVATIKGTKGDPDEVIPVKLGLRV